MRKNNNLTLATCIAIMLNTTLQEKIMRSLYSSQVGGSEKLISPCFDIDQIYALAIAQKAEDSFIAREVIVSATTILSLYFLFRSNGNPLLNIFIVFIGYLIATITIYAREIFAMLIARKFNHHSGDSMPWASKLNSKLASNSATAKIMQEVSNQRNLLEKSKATLTHMDDNLKWAGIGYGGWSFSVDIERKKAPGKICEDFDVKQLICNIDEQLIENSSQYTLYVTRDLELLRAFKGGLLDINGIIATQDKVEAIRWIRTEIHGFSLSTFIRICKRRGILLVALEYYLLPPISDAVAKTSLADLEMRPWTLIGFTLHIRKWLKSFFYSWSLFLPVPGSLLLLILNKAIFPFARFYLRKKAAYHNESSAYYETRDSFRLEISNLEQIPKFILTECLSGFDIIQRKTLNIVRGFLESKNVDISEFTEKVKIIENNNVHINASSINADMLAIGKGSKIYRILQKKTRKARNAP